MRTNRLRRIITVPGAVAVLALSFTNAASAQSCADGNNTKVATTAPPAPAPSQTPASASPVPSSNALRPVMSEGPRVRVSSTTGSIYIGRLLAIENDAIMVRRDGHRVPSVIPRSEVASFGVHQQSRRGGWKGLGLGLLGGAALGGLAGYSGYVGVPDATRSESAMIGAVFLAPIAGAVGALIEANSEEWQEAPLPRSRIPVRIDSRGISAEVGHRF